jgi:hypothetical protein
MLAACRLAGLSALERHYAGRKGCAQFGSTRTPAKRRERIRRAIIEDAERFRHGDVYESAWPAVLAAGSKPSPQRRCPKPPTKGAAPTFRNMTRRLCRDARNHSGAMRSTATRGGRR